MYQPLIESAKQAGTTVMFEHDSRVDRKQSCHRAL